MPFCYIDDTRIFYESTGEGGPIVLIHGAGQDTTSWRYNIPHFAKTHQVVAIDLNEDGALDLAIAGDARGCAVAVGADRAAGAAVDRTAGGVRPVHPHAPGVDGGDLQPQLHQLRFIKKTESFFQYSLLFHLDLLYFLYVCSLYSC